MIALTPPPPSRTLLAARWRAALRRLGIAALLAPAAALGSAELLVVLRGRLNTGVLPSGAHSYLPILSAVGRDRYQLASAAMAALAALVALWRRGSGGPSRPSVRRRLAGWVVALVAAQAFLLAGEIAALGGLDGVPDALPTLLVALAAQVCVTAILVIGAGWAGQAALRVVRRRSIPLPSPRRLADNRPRLRPQRVVPRLAFATPTHRGPPTRVL